MIVRTPLYKHACACSDSIKGHHSKSASCLQLAVQLDADWIQRCKSTAVDPRTVPKVEGLSIRCVNITEKKVEIKEQFRRAFRDKKYPAAQPYTQKVILLFQKIEGVDVLLYVVYVQVRVYAPFPYLLLFSVKTCHLVLSPRSETQIEFVVSNLIRFTVFVVFVLLVGA